MQHSGCEFSGTPQKRTGRSCNQCGNTKGTRTKQLGAKEKAGRKKCHLGFSFARMNRDFLKSYMRIGDDADKSQHSSAEKRGCVRGFAVCSKLSLFGGGVALL